MSTPTSPTAATSLSPTPSKPGRMPSIFLAHGSPILLTDRAWMTELAGWARALPNPARGRIALTHSRPLAGRYEAAIYDLRGRVFEHVQRMPVAFFTRTQTGALVSRLNNDVIGAQQAFTSTLSGVVSNVIGLVLGLAARFALFRTYVFKRPISIVEIYDEPGVVEDVEQLDGDSGPVSESAAVARGRSTSGPVPPSARGPEEG